VQGGSIHINVGSIVYNHCSLQSDNTIYINENLQNNGLIYAASGVGNVIINGAATLTNNGNIVTDGIQLDGNVIGNGYIWATGTTRINGSIGTDGKGINIHDSSTPPSGQFFDVQSGTIDPSVTNNTPTVSTPIPDATDLDYTCGSIIVKMQESSCTIGDDSDGDGITDHCDLDDDNDGIPDVEEGAFISSERVLSFESDAIYAGAEPGPGSPPILSTAVDGVSQYLDGSNNCTALNFVGWSRPGCSSIDWTEGQYVLQSNQNAHLNHPAMISPSPAGGAFAVFSTSGETLTKTIENSWH